MNNIQALNNSHAPPTGGGHAMDPRVVKAAKDFEAVLLNKLMEAMQATIPESGLFEDGTSKQVQSIFWSFLSQDAADKGGMGLWKDLYRQFEGGALRDAGVSPARGEGILPSLTVEDGLMSYGGASYGAFSAGETPASRATLEVLK